MEGVSCTCRHCLALGESRERLPTVLEYIALETTTTAANFDGISKARSTKPKREQADDAQIPEAPIFQEGGGDADKGTGQVEAADLREQQGLAKLGENVQPAHRFDAGMLAKILAFDTAERTQAFVRELKEEPLVKAGGEDPLGIKIWLVVVGVNWAGGQPPGFSTK